MAFPKKRMKTIPIKKRVTGEQAVTHSGFIVGSGKTKAKPSVKALNKHDGIIIGGSVTKGKRPVNEKAINKLPNKRQDGKI